ncbi:hypothetical protein BHM03_00045958 [Ensete ventricosum]|nr:hypothetical protein BHM03_00045958 [Ensete ventricosum]
MDFHRTFLNQQNLLIPYRTHWQNHHRIINGSIRFRLFSLPWGPYTDPDAPGGLWLARGQQKRQGIVPPSFGSGKKNTAPMTTGFAGDEVKASEQFEARGDQRGSPASQKPQIKTRGGEEEGKARAWIGAAITRGVEEGESTFRRVRVTPLVVYKARVASLPLLLFSEWSSLEAMAEHLASIFGTEKDRVNCPFYFKIGACRHGDRCSRLHTKPSISPTLLLSNMYQRLDNAITPGLDSQGQPMDPRQIQEHFEVLNSIFFFFLRCS